MPHPTQVQTALLSLGAARGSVYLEGLTEAEVGAMELEVGLQAPPLLRDYYREVGLVQDLTYAGKHVGLRPFEKARECRQARDGLLEIFGEIADDAFPFALDEADRTCAVVPSSAGERLVIFDLELGTQTPNQLFAEWLAGVVSDAAANADSLVPNSKKRRYVQFTFSAHAEGDVFAAFGEAAEVRQLSSWEGEETSVAGVKTAKRRFALSDQSLTMSRMEHASWPRPIFCVDFSEPASTLRESSLLRRLHQTFGARELGYKLVDYGPMPEH
ncbi:hypothetical protein QTH90_10605 [Variovorax sp. J2P1-59]|uniref:hypothetical protein n=1 Tax=Variovorax flavidus TaxID=3053501 RepID=UPI0025753B0A|nr:hypothetical protein [Variovorax sp. J2P1-59]MDM0074832.1 hypothetical protein [Variovorax sp. J2P1-59]